MSAKGTHAITPSEVRARKGVGSLVCLTAYTTPIARLVDAYCDVALVSDSLGIVLHGLPSTHGVTLEMMIIHGQAVRRGLERALMVVDLPFGSYEEGPEKAFRNAARVMAETGCAAVKLKGGEAMAPTIAFLTARGIPVLAHVSSTPQAVPGRGADTDRIMKDALAVALAGAFGVVLDKVPEAMARMITPKLGIPTIGIGASPACDGQILVAEEMLGLYTEFGPKSVKRYAELGAGAETAVAAYVRDVRERRFPSDEHVVADVR